MHVVYTGQLVRIRPFRDFAEINAVLAEDYDVPDPFRGPRWWPVAAREAEFSKSAMLDSEGYSMLAIDRLDLDELVGIAGCGPYTAGRLTVNIGTYISQKHRRLGFGKEAKQLSMCRLFESYPLEAIRASTLKNHRHARAGLIGCGMKCYGQLRGIEYADGVWYDEVQYEIFRENWEKLPIRDVVRRG